MAKGVKTGGRGKGSTNKKTTELRERVKQFIDDTFPDVVYAFSQLEPKDKVTTWATIVQYVMPKLSNQVIDTSPELKQQVSNLFPFATPPADK